MVALWLAGVGFIFATLSQMGYFEYLTFHRFCLGFFRSLWNPVQFVLVAFVFFDFIYFRYQAFAGENDSILPYIVVALLLLFISITVGYLKMKQTDQRHTFIPAVFFMFCVTILEWLPVLRANDTDWLYLMLFPLLVCNAFQLLKLPDYLARSQMERLEMEKRKEELTTK